jgi:hypothetical protein
MNCFWYALSLPGERLGKTADRYGEQWTIAETNHKNSKLSADALKKELNL